MTDLTAATLAASTARFPQARAVATMDLLNPFGGAVCWVLMTFRTDRGERAFITYGHIREDETLAFDTVTQGPSRYSLGETRLGRDHPGRGCGHHARLDGCLKPEALPASLPV